MPTEYPKDLLARLGDDYPPHVLAAISKVPRHHFVSGLHRDDAYKDHAIPIGYGLTASRPSTIAKCLSAIGRPMRCLEIGTGCGWQTALLSTFSETFSIECNVGLAERAARDLRDYSVGLKVGDGMQGWEDHAPFGAIIVCCSLSEIPVALLGQLTDDGLLAAQIIDTVNSYRKDGSFIETIGKGRYSPVREV